MIQNPALKSGVFSFIHTGFIFISVNENNCKFEVYDDDKLSHMLYAPDYGQVGETELAWNLKSSKEYKNYCLSALSNQFKLIDVLYCYHFN